jgi:hypothetical protein
MTSSKRSPSRSGGDEAKHVAGFISKFDPPTARLIRACRAALRRRLPTAIEQVYDNYNFLAIGYCTTERTSDCLVSLAASAKGVALSFYHGADLADPEGILLGSGSQNRFVRLESAASLGKPALAALIDAAISQARTPLATAARGYTMVKSVSVKQRPRRAAPPSGPSGRKPRKAEAKR